MSSVAIIDYGMCNLDSVARAVEECGGDAYFATDAQAIEGATHIVLPGVGSFSDGMRHIKERSLDDALRVQALEKGMPFLGICLGMQLMATKGWEGGETDGLDLIPGEVIKLKPKDDDTRIPHVGWNEVQSESSAPLLASIESGKDFYFVHSYHFECDNTYVTSRTPYCGSFVSSVARDNIFGTQFHPEKSQKVGFQVLSNFLNMSRSDA